MFLRYVTQLRECFDGGMRNECNNQPPRGNMDHRQPSVPILTPFTQTILPPTYNLWYKEKMMAQGNRGIILIPEQMQQSTHGGASTIGWTLSALV